MSHQASMRSWWRHQMETFSASLALCADNLPVTGEFPAQRPVTRSFDVYLICALNKRLGKQSRGWWFETPSCSLWRHRSKHLLCLHIDLPRIFVSLWIWMSSILLRLFVWPTIWYLNYFLTCGFIPIFLIWLIFCEHQKYKLGNVYIDLYKLSSQNILVWMPFVRGRLITATKWYISDVAIAKRTTARFPRALQ